jgi:hypothetical protein
VPKHSPHPATGAAVCRSTTQPPMVPSFRKPPKRRAYLRAPARQPPPKRPPSRGAARTGPGASRSRHRVALSAGRSRRRSAACFQRAWAVRHPAEAGTDPARESRSSSADDRSHPCRTTHPLVRGNRSCLARAVGPAHSVPPKRSGATSALRRPGRASSPTGFFSPRESAACAPMD